MFNYACKMCSDLLASARAGVEGMFAEAQSIAKTFAEKPAPPELPKKCGRGACGCVKRSHAEAPALAASQLFGIPFKCNSVVVDHSKYGLVTVELQRNDGVAGWVRITGPEASEIHMGDVCVISAQPATVPAETPS